MTHIYMLITVSKSLNKTSIHSFKSNFLRRLRMLKRMKVIIRAFSYFRKSESKST